MSAVTDAVSDIDTTLAVLDSNTEEGTINKLTLIKNRLVLGFDLSGKRRKRSDESKKNYFFLSEFLCISSVLASVFFTAFSNYLFIK